MGLDDDYKDFRVYRPSEEGEGDDIIKKKPLKQNN